MNAGAASPAVRARALDVILGGRAVLEGLDLTLHTGEILAVVGSSGSGKTTLIHVLAGLRGADGGRVEVQGTALDPRDLDQSDRLRREVVAFMAQDLDLLPELTGAQNAALPVLIAGGTPAKALTAARALLDRFGMADHLSQPVKQLSRGQRQRVALARALAQPRPVLLLDEPTASLDPTSRDQAIGHLRKRAVAGAAVLITTHDLEVAAQADRVLHLHQGRLEAEG